MELPVDSCWMTSLKGMKEPGPVGKPNPEGMPSGPVNARLGPEGRKWLKANGWTMGTPKKGLAGLALTRKMEARAGMGATAIGQTARLKKRGSAGLQPASTADR